MTISIAFGINASMLSLNISSFKGNEFSIALFFIVVVGVLLIRPYSLKVIYKMLYEPYSRVESYEENTALQSNGIDNNNLKSNIDGPSPMVLYMGDGDDSQKIDRSHSVQEVYRSKLSQSGKGSHQSDSIKQSLR